MITIHRAKKEDIAGIKNVLAVTWLDTYSSFLPETTIATVTAEWHSPKKLGAEIDRPTTYFGIAKICSGEIVGMVTAFSQDDCLVIARLYVLPAFQRQGIGQRLLENSLRNFKNIRRIQLEVEEQNAKGRKFYRKVGFAEVGTGTANVADAILNTIVLEKMI